MKGMLLGLAGMIADAIGDVVMGLVTAVVELIFNFIVKPILWLVFQIVSYTVGFIAYTIGRFLLQLIDFVEILFRALAGLDSTGANGMSISLSLDGDSGDILIQLIRNPDIQQAFLAMCIVGLFLLVVTTVFQIIKVEYTTEGAKNAKGPIFQKAFKGLANLMLLPLLVVFGIIFANQLLGLLDKATSVEGKNPTISGLIFVASSSDAFYLKDEEPVIIESHTILGGSLDATFAAVKVFIDNLGDPSFWDGGGWDNSQGEFALSDDQREEIESSFISQSKGYLYYDITNVCKYYNYASINYLLLLFGAVFVLKSLFFTCFGMIIRLYRCAILFIISPAVIGMTPINEGGLGKWRTSFIGQVLAAYGTILSLNLFFVVVRVLLSIEIKFTLPDESVGFLSSSLMTMLLKAIFVLAGCLLIEKFSKEIGGYFGAEDAMGAGKDMAGQVGDLAMKGVGAAAMVATGGASLAMKGVKAAGGIAGKVANSGLGQLAGESAHFVGDKVKGLGVVKQAGKLAGGVKDFGGKVADKVGGVTSKIGDGLAWFGGGQAAVDARNYEELSEESKDKEKDISRKTSIRNQIVSGKGWTSNDVGLIRKKAKNGEKLTDDEKKFIELSEDIDKQKKERKKLEKRSSAAGKILDEKDDARAKRGRSTMDFIGGIVGMAEQGRKNLPGNKYFDQFDKARDSGAKRLGDPFEAAHKSVEYVKGKETQDMAHDAFARLIDKQNAAGARIVARQVSKEAETKQGQIVRFAENDLQNLAQTLKSITDKDQQARYIDSTVQRLNSNGANVTFQDIANMIGFNAHGDNNTKQLQVAAKGDLKLTMDDLNIKFNPKEIEDALNKALSKGASSPEEIKNAVKEVMEQLGKEGNANMIKIISDLLEKQLSNLPK